MATAKKRATIKDVAAEAGVSYQTVSRVINNQSGVTDETRHRVKEAIEALNFRPSLAARSLPRRRFYVIGLIIPYDADYLARDPHLLKQLSGIDAEANAHNYNVLLSTAGDPASGTDAFKRFARNHVADGALVIETASSEAGSDLLVKQDYSFITLGYDRAHPDGYSVHSDDYGGAQAATRHLLERGHRRIGIINGPPTGAVAALDERLRGHQQILAEAGLSFDPALMVYGDYTRLSGQVATAKLLTLLDPPTAIFAFNDRMAMGAMRALQIVHLTVPDDVAVVGFDNIPAAADVNPGLTTVRQPSREIGQMAAQMLFKLIDNTPSTQKEIILPAELVVRQSS